MKSLLTISILAILATSMALTAISGNVFAQQFPKPSSPNDWGQVVSVRAQEESMAHSSDPVNNNEPGTSPQDIDRETPRQGVGNVALPGEPDKHPAFHANALCDLAPGAPGCSNINPNDPTGTLGADSTSIVGGQ
jgi:hypothetical protein